MNSWSVLGNTSCSLITFLIQSETCTRPGVSFRRRTPREPLRRNRPPARQNLPQRRRAAALVARGGRTREYRAPIGPGSRGACRLVRAAAFLEGSAEVGSAGAEGSAGGGGRGAGLGGDGGRVRRHELTARSSGPDLRPQPCPRCEERRCGQLQEPGSSAAARLLSSPHPQAPSFSGCVLLKNNDKSTPEPTDGFFCH